MKHRKIKAISPLWASAALAFMALSGCSKEEPAREETVEIYEDTDSTPAARAAREAEYTSQQDVSNASYAAAAAMSAAEASAPKPRR